MLSRSCRAAEIDAVGLLYKDIMSEKDPTGDFLCGTQAKKSALAHTLFKRLASVGFLEVMCSQNNDSHAVEARSVVLVKLGTFDVSLDNFAPPTRPFQVRTPAVGGEGGNYEGYRR